MRSSGALDDVAATRHGDHVCWRYGSEREHRSVLTAHMRAGVAAGERVVYFGDRYGSTTVDRYLKDVGVNPTPLRDRGQLVVLDARSSYMPTGVFDPEAMAGAFAAAADDAVASGFTGLRAASETAWILNEIDPRTFVRFELDCDPVVRRSPMVGLCGYDAREADRDVLAQLTAVHHAWTWSDFADEPSFALSARGPGDVLVTGEVDLVADVAWRELLALLTADAGDLVMDVGEVRFMDVGALRSLAALGRRIAPRTLTLRNARPVIRRAWDLLGFTGIRFE